MSDPKTTTFPLKRVARIAEIARHAGVSKATVDRVMNGRRNVSITTRQRVLQAKMAIETGEGDVQRAHPWRLKVLLPKNAGPSTEFLATCFQEVGARGRATVECIFTRKMEPVVLASKLRACLGQGIDAVAFQALEDPRIRDAVAELAHYDIPSLALLSGLESPAVVGYVGIDNRAAGRTSGLLMGRMTRPPGRIAIISGGQLYRSHEDREMGFRSVLRAGYPEMAITGAYAGYDDIEANHTQMLRLLNDNPDLTGIYNVGGGNEGIVRALKEAGRDREIIMVGHNLTPKTHAYLLDGSMDIILHQNMRATAHQAVEILVLHLDGRPVSSQTLPVEIITRENTQGAVFG